MQGGFEQSLNVVPTEMFLGQYNVFNKTSRLMAAYWIEVAKSFSYLVPHYIKTNTFLDIPSQDGDLMFLEVSVNDKRATVTSP